MAKKEHPKVVVKVDTTELNEAIEKLQKLLDMLYEVQKLLDTLYEVKKLLDTLYEADSLAPGILRGGDVNENEKMQGLW